MEKNKVLCLNLLFSAVDTLTDELYPSNGVLISSGTEYYPIERSSTVKSVDYINGWFSGEADLYKILVPFIWKTVSGKERVEFISNFIHAASKNLGRKYRKNVFDNYLLVDSNSKIDKLACSLENAVRRHCYFHQLNVRIKNYETVYRINTDYTVKSDLDNHSGIYESSFKRFSNLLIEKAINMVKDLFDCSSELLEVIESPALDGYKKLSLITILCMIPKDIYFDEFKDEVHNHLIKPLFYLYCKNTLKSSDIWNAGKHWYDDSQMEGHRFAGFSPDIDLFPFADVARNIPINAEDSNNVVKPLTEMLSSTSGHIFLVGEGGIGKTTTLYSIMRNAYDEDSNQTNKQIPLFIELSMAYDRNDFSFDKNKLSSLYIHHEIQRQLVSVLNNEINLNEITMLFSQKDADKPEYVLLLDGLNEVSRDKLGNLNTESNDKPNSISYDISIATLVINEIRFIMENYKNVRVILTGRAKEVFGENVTYIKLLGIDKETVQQYLIDNNVENQKIEMALSNTRLMDTLRIPLFLILYTKLSGNEKILSRGEILHSFFTQKKYYYTEKHRAFTINDELIRKFNITKTNASVTPIMLCFILDFIIPEIAWNMVENNAYQISRDKIEIIVSRLLTDRSDTSILGRFGRVCFTTYSETETVIGVARKMMRVFENNDDNVDEKWEIITAGICECLCLQLGILLKKSNCWKYEFIHQHFRDYFAALYHINRIKLAVYIFENNNSSLARECLTKMAIQPLPAQVLEFIGESLGEVHNTPVFDMQINKWLYAVPNPQKDKCDRNLIKRTFDIYRNCYEQPYGYYAVWNLFQTLKLTRKDLSGEDFSNLDLSHCCANGYTLGNTAFSADLSGTKLTDSFFMPNNLLGRINSVHFCPNEKYLLIASENVAKIMDCTSFEEVGTLEQDSPIILAQYSEVDDYIVTITKEHVITVWDSKTLKAINSLKINDRVKTVKIFPTANLIIVLTRSFSGNTLTLLDVPSLEELIRNNADDNLDNVYASPSMKYMVFVLDNGHVCIFDTDKVDAETNTFEMVGHIDLSYEDPKVYNSILTVLPPVVNSVHFSPNEEYLILSFNNYAKIWDTTYFKVVGVLEHNDTVFMAQYNPAMNYITTRSCFNDIIIWDAETFEEIGTIKDTELFSSLEYSPSGEYLVAYNTERIKIMSAITFENITIDAHYKRPIISAQYSQDEQFLAVVSGDGTAIIWDTASCKVVNTLKCNSAINTAIYSPYGKSILIADDNSVIILDADSYKIKGILKDHNNTIERAEYSPNEKYIMTLSSDKVLKIWETSTLKQIKSLDKYDIKTAHYSPNSKLIVITSFCKKTATVIDAETLKEVCTLNDHEGSLESAQFSRPNGDYIITCGGSGTAKIWSAESYKAVYNLFHYPEYMCKPMVYSAEYSPTGDHIATYSSDALVIWDATSFYEISYIDNLHGFQGFSPLGNYIVTTSIDGTDIWDAITCEPICHFPNAFGLEVCNLDLCHLNKNSKISDELLKLLKMYGAKTEDL